MSASEPPCCVPSEVSPWPPGPLSDRSTSVSAWVGAAVWSSAPLPLWARAAGEIIASAASRDIRFTRIHLSFPGSDPCSPPIPSVTASPVRGSGGAEGERGGPSDPTARRGEAPQPSYSGRDLSRSEEHTSELQS